MTRSLDNIREYLSYDRATGLFTWIVSPNNRAPKGSMAGVCYNRGEIGIRFGGKRYLAHRLAWWFEHGEMPKQIDHQNGNPSDNRLDNLRPCTQSENLQNKRGHNKAGLPKGVSYRKGGRYQAMIGINYKQIYLGCFGTATEAALAYDRAARKHFGEFARLNFPGEQP